MKRLKILIWHIHGSYLNYLSCAPHDFYLPIKQERSSGYQGLGETFDWGKNVFEVPAEEVKNLKLDLIIFQSPKNFLIDQYEILSEKQRKLPKIYLEHNTPREHPTDTKHLIDDPKILLVHVTHFNNLMWNSGKTQTLVIEHGLPDPSVTFRGNLAKGVVVVNEIQRRDRIAGYDIWQKAKEKVPLDLIGMRSEELGGRGDIPHRALFGELALYRFFFNPIRYTSLPLSLIEAMMVGLPVVALATTEVASVVENNVSGFVSNDLDFLIGKIRFLLGYPEEAKKIGQKGRETALVKFGIDRFVKNWNKAFEEVRNL
ncbi:MAG: glycosyltransferase [Patescibacteria group bacterium]|nr:glycosyltransferase [Patescibacteria group bacterium]